MADSKQFSGKWCFATAAGLMITQGDNGLLTLAAPGAKGQWLNGYGGASGCWLQASDGRYVSPGGDIRDGIAADQPRDGTLAVLTVEPFADGQCFIFENTGAGKIYFNASSTGLEWLSVSGTLPKTVLFSQIVVTAGLAQLRQASAMGASLTRAFLAGEDLSRMVFMGADLSNADLRAALLDGANLVGTTLENTLFTGCKFRNTDLSGSSGGHVNFDNSIFDGGTKIQGATLPDASFQNCNSMGTSANLNGLVAPRANFSGSKLSHILLNNATLTDAILINVDLGNASVAAAHFGGATMTKINLQNTTLNTADFSAATLAGADFTGAEINNAIFKGAVMANALLSKAKGTTLNLDLTDALLIGADLTALDLTTATISRLTNFTGAQMGQINLTGQKLDGVTFQMAMMAGAKLDRTSLINAVLVGTVLSNATITGHVSLVGANLSNASLDSADMTGAQFGALAPVGMLEPACAQALDSHAVPSTLLAMLAASQRGLTGQPTVHVLQAGSNWRIEHDGRPLMVDRTAAGLAVASDSGASAAILTNVFMPNAILTGANLYAVDMSGVNWYGASAMADNANLEQVNFSSANLATMVFTQARLYGANLSYANLIGTDFSKALLSPTEGLKPASLAFASLQGTIFTAAALGGANLTNGAVALSLTIAGTSQIGTPVFVIDDALAATLDAGVVSSALSQTFTTHGYTLAIKGVFTVLTAGQGWIIDNNVADSDLSYRGYTRFILGAVSQNGSANIQVYGGTPIRIVRLAADNTQQPVNVAFGPTLGLDAAMNDETTCPSGLRYKMLQSPGITYQDLMTPGLPPHPPACIPSPTTWCT